jgi:isoamylase
MEPAPAAVPWAPSGAGSDGLIRRGGGGATAPARGEVKEYHYVMTIWPGQPYPLGATYDGAGTNFSVFSEVAESLVLCLFDEDGNETQVDLPETTAFCWHGYLPGVGPDQRYGFRVHGPWAPHEGKRSNPQKLLLDPYARAVVGQVEWNDALLPYPIGNPDGPPSESDSAPYVPKSVIIDPHFDWSGDKRPRTAWHETIVYEAHVKGLTMRHPEVPPELRGTYAGVAHPAVIDYLRRLGITAIELEPTHQFVQDGHLLKRGLRNYWGYNSIGFFAPHNEY